MSNQSAMTTCATQVSSVMPDHSEVTPRLAASASAAEHVSRCALGLLERLAALADRIESFLLGQVQKLESILAQPVASDGADVVRLEQLVRQTEARMHAWDQERQQERERLREDSRRLTEAWTRLESERRQLITERELIHVAASGFAGAPTTPESDLVHAVRRAIESSLAAGISVKGPAASNANSCYQQLQRQVRQHAQHRRP